MSKKARKLNEGLRVVHMIISPSPELVKAMERGELSFEELRAMAEDYLYLKSKGEYSGGLIFHPFRPSDRYYTERGEQREDEEDPENDKKKWEWIRTKEDWELYVEFSPHFHYVGWVGWMDKPEKGEDWIYKMIKTNGHVARFDISKKAGIELFRVVHYLLTHTGTTKIDNTDTDNFFSYSYLGNIANCLGGIAEASELNAKVRKDKGFRCKDCKGELDYVNKSLNRFFKVYVGIAFPELLSNADKRHYALNAQVEDRIKKNVIECIDRELIMIRNGGKPPPEGLRYIVD